VLATLSTALYGDFRSSHQRQYPKPYRGGQSRKRSVEVMKRLIDLAEPQAYLSLPRIERHDITLLWVSDFWDVPLTGMLLYQGRKYWFQTTEDPRENEAAELIYLVIELTAEQLREKEYWHELFRQKVGTHWDYDEHGHSSLEGRKPQSTHHEFYDAYKQRPKPDYSNNMVIGWLEGLV
jgi:hypothetical protein